MYKKSVLLVTALTMVVQVFAGFASSVQVANAQTGWTEPAIAPIMMTAPLTPPPVTGTTFYVDKSNLGGTCNNNNNPGTQTQPWCTIPHPNQTRYPGQRMYVIAIEAYAYLVPFVEEEEKIFLKTIIPNRKATRRYLSKEAS
jgi:hypothetical protein